jgi:hypothetical protein
MPRKSKADMASSIHEHQAAAGKYETKASGETHTKSKGHLMSGIVSGMPKRNLPLVIDGIIRGCPKYTSHSLSADTMHVKPSATKDNQASFGSGLFPEGKQGK